MVTPKYYDKIENLSKETQNIDAGMEFDFAVLRGTGLQSMATSWLLSQRWIYAILRRCKPVLKLGNLYLVTRYDDVAYIRQNETIFEAPYGPEMKALTGGENFLLGMGNETGYRRQFEFIMGKSDEWEGAFRKTDVEEIIAPHVRCLAKQLLTHSGGKIDVIQDYLTRICTETCARYYGFEPDDPDAFAQWLMSLSALLFADYTGKESTRRLALIGAKRVEEVVRRAIDKAKLALQNGNPLDETVIGRLVGMQKSHRDGPSDDEIVAIIIGLCVGFVPTGASAGGNILEVLFKRKKHFQAAVAAAKNQDDTSLSGIIREAMRFKPPINPGLPRYVNTISDPSTTNGSNARIDAIPAGATVLAASASAMFDKSVLGSNIGEFLPGRTLPKEDLQFGGQFLHYCFGEQIFNRLILESLKYLFLQNGLKRSVGKTGRIRKIGPFPQHMTVTFDPKISPRNQSMTTICIPLEADFDITDLNNKITNLGNPANQSISDALNKTGIIHFAQMTAIHGAQSVDNQNTSVDAGVLLVEINADGSTENAIRSFVRSAWEIEGFKEIFASVSGTGNLDDIEALLLAHHYELSILPWNFSRKKTTGLNFPGRPELSVDRIQRDKQLADFAKASLDYFVRENATTGIMPAEAISYVRQKIRRSPHQVELVRPTAQTLSVSRRKNLPLSDTLDLFLKDWGVRGTVFLSLLLCSAVYFVFLRGNFPSELSLAAMSKNFFASLRVIWSFIFGGIVASVLATIVGTIRGRRSLPLIARIKEFHFTHRTSIIVSCFLAGILHLVFFANPIGLDNWDTKTYSHRLSTVGLISWQLITSLIMGVIFLGTLVLVLLFDLRRLLNHSENTSPPRDLDVDLGKYQDIMRHENHSEYVQNHIVIVNPLKDNPKWLRRVTLFIGFYFIKKLVQYRFRPGFVLDIGTIHFARWFILPKSHTMIFLSNYDGSGESYFEDFVTKAQWGQTGVWSNAKGFPYTKNLLFKGARDATRFKRWVRNNQVVSRFWYSRFPKATTSQIRKNALICEGLAKARTDTEYRAWIDMIGSRPRPANALETREIQSLLLGGMGKFKASALIAVKFPKETDKTADISEWLGHVSGYLKGIRDGDLLSRATFDNQLFNIEADDKPNDKVSEISAQEPSEGKNKETRQDHAMNIAFSASGLRRIGLDRIKYYEDGQISTTLQSFPAAFQSGMHSDDRTRLLGDDVQNKKDSSEKWGDEDKSVDAVLMLYAKDKATITKLTKREKKGLERKNIEVQTTILTDELPEEINNVKEPFGFRDGISQPIIRGSKKYFDGANDIHVVEPGEFILGYGDNAGYYPTTPVVSATTEGSRILPSLPDQMPDRFPAFSSDPFYAPRDLGRNGSFLVIRQLEQNVSKFNRFLERQSEIIKGRYKLDHVTPNWVGAKIVGRWKDGSSLFKHPFISRSEQLDSQEATTVENKAIAASENHVSPGTANYIRVGIGSASVAPVDFDFEVPEDKTLHFKKGDTKSISRVFLQNVKSGDNDFLPGMDDPQGLQCPFSAHIRRANPRDSFAPGQPKQLEISNRHRILRRGRSYTDGKKTGLLFMCLNANIERQYEFIQQTWLNSATFHGLNEDTDTLSRTFAGGKFTISTSAGPVQIKNLQSFVRLRGGGYFFLPSRSAIRFFFEHLNKKGSV